MSKKDGRSRGIWWANASVLTIKATVVIALPDATDRKGSHINLLGVAVDRPISTASTVPLH